MIQIRENGSIWIDELTQIDSISIESLSERKSDITIITNKEYSKELKYWLNK
jgi:hypothetical protein